MSDDEVVEAKRRVRAEVLRARKAIDPAELHERAARLGARIDQFAAERDARVVTLYASVGTEPGTREALRLLHERGVQVLLPIVLPDLDLDWAAYSPGAWREARMGLVEPEGGRLGLDAIGAADVVFCPGVAGTPDGRRLGRGGGCYDRALTRARADAPRCLVVYDENVLADLPTTARDQRVDAVLTPDRLIHARATD